MVKTEKIGLWEGFGIFIGTIIMSPAVAYVIYLGYSEIQKRFGPKLEYPFYYYGGGTRRNKNKSKGTKRNRKE